MNTSINEWMIEQNVMNYQEANTGVYMKQNDMVVRGREMAAGNKIRN